LDGICNDKVNWMPPLWRLINSGEGDGAFNMALDEAISVMVRRGDSPPTLRLYRWGSPWVSVGRFQAISEVDLDYCRSRAIGIVRRPTGGRGILHGKELTYSFSARNEGCFSGGLRESYRLLGDALKTALAGLGLEADATSAWRRSVAAWRSPVCFQALSFGEISVGGRKVVGSAQRRWADGFLQQGSIPYRIDYLTLLSAFRPGTGTGQPETGSGTGMLRTRMAGLEELIPSREGSQLGEQLVGAVESLFRVRLEAAPHSPQELDLALRLAEEKYRNPRWTLERVRHNRF
jgi:lipoate-protein ligase A